jgi:hypothetical protein
MKRAPLRRKTPLRNGPGPGRRTPLPRRPLRPGPWRTPAGEDTGSRRAPFGASEAQREKIVGGACVVCRQTKGLTPRTSRRARRAAAITPTAWCRCAGRTTAPMTLAGSNSSATSSRSGEPRSRTP